MASIKKSGRQKKPTHKVLANADASLDTSRDAREKWCKIYCDQDSKTHVVSARTLEPEDSDDLTVSHLIKGNTLLWKVKGQKYTATLLEVHDHKPSAKRQHQDRERASNDDHVEESDEDTISNKRKASVIKLYGSSDDDTDNDDNKCVPEVAPTPSKLSACNCNKDLSRVLSSKVATLENSITILGSKVDKVYAVLKKSRISSPAQLHQSSTQSSSTSSASYPSSSASSAAYSSAISSDTDSGINIKLETHLDNLDDPKYISENGVRLLGIRALNPCKYALALMDALFTDEEMAMACFSRGPRSSKPELPQAKLDLLQDCIDKKYGPGTVLKFEIDIKRKCNQKCLDAARKFKVSSQTTNE